MFRRLMIKLYVAFKGIRFYTTERTPLRPEFKKCEFVTMDGKVIQFYFYKEIFTDYVRKHNRTKEVQHVAYSIRMQVDNTMPSHIQEYNNLKVVFKYDSIVGKLEEDLDRELLLQYMHFLESLIKQ
jgi:hypothetical protein